MTCEVAVMNKYALVIAADSAVTTTNGDGAERYSKGGNKIFQLSRHEPVGVMIYGSAMLNGVPWEIVIKNYRDVLGATKFPTLQEYATAFFDFVKTATRFFPRADLDEYLWENVLRIALAILSEGRKKSPVLDDATSSNEQRTEAWTHFLQAKREEVGRLETHPGITEEALAAGIAHVSAVVEGHALIAYLASVNLSEIISPVELVDIACREFFRTFRSILGRTGIVFSGFGEDQFFPVVIQYDVYGFVHHDFLFRKIDSNSSEVSHNDPSGIFQFAMTSSIDTFTTGIGFDTYAEVNRAYRQSAKDLAIGVLKANNIDDLPANFPDTLQSSCDTFCSDWADKIMAVHYHPMKRVIASLPIQEMVHLAETLIVLQSLKERITTHSESVGGPVDIAVITKSEGLVWIKRKHYFTSDNNLPYVMRQKAQYD
jgi:hypothetical protein